LGSSYLWGKWVVSLKANRKSHVMGGKKPRRILNEKKNLRIRKRQKTRWKDREYLRLGPEPRRRGFLGGYARREHVAKDSERAFTCRLVLRRKLTGLALKIGGGGEWNMGEKEDVKGKRVQGGFRDKGRRAGLY